MSRRRSTPRCGAAKVIGKSPLYGERRVRCSEPAGRHAWHIARAEPGPGEKKGRQLERWPNESERRAA